MLCYVMVYFFATQCILHCCGQNTDFLLTYTLLVTYLLTEI